MIPEPDLAERAYALDLPFDAKKLDDLLDDAGIDVAVITSKHNIQYLLGGYRFFFFENFDAIGISRYLPIMIYPKGMPENAVYIGNSMEAAEADNGRFWCRTIETSTSGSLDAIELAAKHIRRLGLAGSRIGAEFAFIPADAMDALRSATGAEVVDAHFPLERLRAVKQPYELALIREASERVVSAMVATFPQARPGMTKRALSECLRGEELKRGLRFDYCLISAGQSFNRAPSDQILLAGDVISLDSGGTYGGYFGDLCRMGILGEPDQELQDLLGWIEDIQQAARRPIAPGTPGRAIFDSIEGLLSGSPDREHAHFVAHGMGIIGHEAPRLTGSGPVKYPAVDADLPLRAGMVLSIETTLMHPRRGYIKLEDTVAVSDDGWEAYGDAGRGWNSAL